VKALMRSCVVTVDSYAQRGELRYGPFLVVKVKGGEDEGAETPRHHNAT